MNISYHFITILLLSVCSLAAFAADQCSSISCDCQNLPTKSWVNTCQNQESRLIANCVKDKKQDLGYCSLHGPMANRLPLELNVKAIDVELVNIEDVPKLNNRVAVLYWAIIKDFDSLESYLLEHAYSEAEKKLDTINTNAQTLFEIQVQATRSFSAANREALAQMAWRDYSADTLSFGSDFYIRAESILNTYDDVADAASRSRYRDIGLRLMALSGKVYEQVGYAYAGGMRHKHAAKAWKNAASASALVMAHSSAENMPLGFYRFQSAARLHRASYHWVIGSGRGSAEESLAESQKFMDDDSSISSLVEEEKQINASKPFWSR